VHVPGSAHGRDAVSASALAALVVACGVDAALGGTLLQRGPVLLLLASVAGAAGAWIHVALAAPLLGVCSAVLASANQVTAPGDFPFWNDVAFFAVLLGAPALATRALVGRARQVRDLAERTTQLERQQAEERRAAQLEEQARVEAGVQRAVVQRLGAISLQAAGAERAARTDPPGTREALLAVETSARAALDELRDLLGSLRVPHAEPAAAEPVVTVVAPAPVGSLDVAAGALGLVIAAEAVTSPVSRGPAWANVLAALAMTLPLVWRRHRPVAVLAASLLVTVVMATFLTPPDALVSTLVPVLLVPFAVTAHAAGARRLVGLGGLLAGVLGIVVVAGPGDGTLPLLVAVTVSAATGWAWHGRSRRLAQLTLLEERLRHGRQAAARLAAAERRQAIARELHDVVAHAMTVVCLHSAGARRAGPQQTAAAARTMGAVTRDAMEQLRRALDELDSDVDPPRELDPAALVDTARASGTPVTLTVHGRPRTLRASVARAAERTLQEALTNSARHAPGATIDVTVTWEPDAVVVEVRDSHGPRPVESATVGSGSGLAGLRERARSRGGTLEAGPTDTGFGVLARLPVDRGSS
jgi:signal transduction histidine kinase